MFGKTETLTPEQKVAQDIIKQATKGTFDVSSTISKKQDSITESNNQPSTNHSNVNNSAVDSNVDQFLNSWTRAHDTFDSSVNVTTNQIG